MLRTARIYVCTAAEPPTSTQFCEAVSGAPWAPLEPLKLSCIGFHAASEHADDHAPLAIGDWFVARIRYTERRVSSKAVAEAIEPRLKEAEARNGGSIRAAEKREIADEIRTRLQHQAPPESDYTWVCYHPKRRLIVMDGTASRCELILSLLRGCLGSLGVRPAVYGRPADGVMTMWLRNSEPPENVEIGQSCDMEHPQDTANKIRFRAQPLDEDEVTAALDRGLRVTALELLRDIGAAEPLTFTLHEDCSLRSIRHPFVEVEFDEEAMEDPLARMRADLTLELDNIQGTIDMLSRELGGMAELEQVA
ncbi:MAG TPA: recombination-associated protein RdgC [Acidimicrobiia bacterium]